MTAFLVTATALVAIVLLVVILPMRRIRGNTVTTATEVNVGIYRDQLRELDADLAAGTIDAAQHAEARADIERRLIEDAVPPPPTAAVTAHGNRALPLLAIAIPVGTLALYLITGTPEGLNPAAVNAPPPVSEAQITAMVDKLAARLKQKPDDNEGWIMLGRSYAILERFEDSAKAYAEAVKRIPGDARLLTDYADALAMAQGQNLAGEPEKLIARALAIDPANGKALALAGTAAFQNKQYTAAIGHWEKLLKGLPPDSEIARAVEESLAEARSMRAGKSDLPMTGKNDTPQAAAVSVSGVVRLKPELKDRVKPEDTVFIFARAANGPPAPLAVLRKRVSDLPVKFILDDSMAMAPGMTLSRFDRVIIGARISRSGQAMRQTGDLEGFSGETGNRARDLTIVIGEEAR
jgi:cytochrome c-type biogenesis protein CcmH